MSAMVLQDPYQQRANECLQLAEQSLADEEKTTWRQLALCWLRLSDHAEHFRHETKSRAA
jgi:hypothetical protein